jgi:sugar lactone lactonase YvrE
MSDSARLEQTQLGLVENAMMVGRGAAVGALVGWQLLAGCRPAVSTPPPPPPPPATTPSGVALTIDQPGLYPETVVYDPPHQRFLVGSMRDGAIYAVAADGVARRFADDARLTSVLGMAIDPLRGALWAVDADLGLARKRSVAGPKAEAHVGVFDLESGRASHWVDLASLRPGPHLLNGIALDAAGNAYITDSFSPAIYRVTPQAEASLLLSDDQFAGEGVSLNGLVVHPDGFLLVVKKSEGALFRVPLANPAAFTKVALDRPIFGADGVLLSSPSELIVIANKTPQTTTNAALLLRSDDGWASAKIRTVEPLGSVYPTTAALRDGQLFVLHSNLDELLGSTPEQRTTLARRATLLPIGTVGFSSR